MVCCISRRSSAVGTSLGVSGSIKPLRKPVIEADCRLAHCAFWITTLASADRRRATKHHQSINEFEPRRLAPCTDAHPASPTAIRPGDIRVWVCRSRVQNFPPIIGRNAAHIIVHGRQNRNWLFGHVNACKDPCRFGNARQASAKASGWQMAKVQVNVIAIWPQRHDLREFPSSYSEIHNLSVQDLYSWEHNAP